MTAERAPSRPTPSASNTPPFPVSATATLQGKYGGFAARGTYDVNFNVQGFKVRAAPRSRSWLPWVAPAAPLGN